MVRGWSKVELSCLALQLASQMHQVTCREHTDREAMLDTALTRGLAQKTLSKAGSWGNSGSAMMEISFAPPPLERHAHGPSAKGERDRERMARARGSLAKGSRSRAPGKHRHTVTPCDALRRTRHVHSQGRNPGPSRGGPSRCCSDAFAGFQGAPRGTSHSQARRATSSGKNLPLKVVFDIGTPDWRLKHSSAQIRSHTACL